MCFTIPIYGQNEPRVYYLPREERDHQVAVSPCSKGTSSTNWIFTAEWGPGQSWCLGWCRSWRSNPIQKLTHLSTSKLFNQIATLVLYCKIIITLDATILYNYFPKINTLFLHFVYWLTGNFWVDIVLYMWAIFYMILNTIHH